MSELLAQGGKVDLWAGWSMTLPPSCYQCNGDGSWSAWGADWTVDVHIIEVGGGADGRPMDPAKLLGNETPVNVSGAGWVGLTEVQTEQDGGRSVFRVAGKVGRDQYLDVLLGFVFQ